jgi:predicted acetyltransferase
MNALNIQLATIPPERKSELSALLQDYQTELAGYSGEAPESRYPYFDLYWQEPARHPFFILNNGRVAGFVLVRRLVEGPNPAAHSVAEFYVLPAYRHRGIGREAAWQAFRMFPGRWHVAQEAGNTPAQLFWQRVVGEFSCGDYRKITQPGWDGPVLEFEAG